MTTTGVAAGQINLTELMDNSRVGWLQVRVFALCLAALIMDGFDVQVVGYVATTMLPELNAPPSALGGLLSVGNVGVLLGALIFSMVADKIGRRPVLVWATLFFAVMTLATAFAQNLEQMRWLRLIAGIGLGCIIPNATALVGEFSPKRTRVAWVMCITMGFTLGAAVGGLVTNWLIEAWGWRSVFIFGGVVPLIIAVLMFVGLPESLQFLAVRRRRLDQLGRWLKQLHPTLHVDASTQFTTNETSRGGVPFWHLFREGRAFVTTMFWIVNFTNILVLYSLSGWLPTIFQNLMGYDRSTAILDKFPALEIVQELVIFGIQQAPGNEEVQFAPAKRPFNGRRILDRSSGWSHDSRIAHSAFVLLHTHIPHPTGSVRISGRMIGKAPSEVKPILGIINPLILQPLYRLQAHQALCNQPPARSHVRHHALAGNSRAGVTRMAILSLTVLQTCSHRPHPTQRLLATARRMSEKSMDKAWVGHWETQAWHPCPAVQSRCDTTANPIRTSPGCSTGIRASVAQAAMHGKSSQRWQGT